MKKILHILRAFFGHTFFVINIVVSLWLLACLYASVASPLQHDYIALLSLSTPFALLASFAFVFIWLFTRKKWRMLLPLLTLLICHNLIMPIFGLHFFGRNNMDATLDGLKIMTWNVHGLGLYERPADKLRPEKMFELIDEQDPDVLCMIEYYTKSDGSNAKAARYFRDAGYREYRFSYDNTLGTKVYIGNAIFSKYPLSNFEEVELDDHIKMMRCDVAMPDERKVRLFAMHLQSFLLDDGDKVFIEEVKANTNKLDQKPGYSRTFFRKLRQAYKKRAPQADKARDEIAGSPYPVVLCADFNDVPMSYTYTTVKGNLRDAFAVKGRGLGRTYNMISPTLRIDYIFYDAKALDLIGYESIPTDLSDHNPVIANFRAVISK